MTTLRYHFWLLKVLICQTLKITLLKNRILASSRQFLVCQGPQNTIGMGLSDPELPCGLCSGSKSGWSGSRVKLWSPRMDWFQRAHPRLHRASQRHPPVRWKNTLLSEDLSRRAVSPLPLSPPRAHWLALLSGLSPGRDCGWWLFSIPMPLTFCCRCMLVLDWGPAVSFGVGILPADSSAFPPSIIMQSINLAAGFKSFSKCDL